MDKAEQARLLIAALRVFAKGLPSEVQVELLNAIYAIERWLEHYERITK